MKFACCISVRYYFPRPFGFLFPIVIFAPCDVFIRMSAIWRRRNLHPNEIRAFYPRWLPLFLSFGFCFRFIFVFCAVLHALLHPRCPTPSSRRGSPRRLALLAARFTSSSAMRPSASRSPDQRDAPLAAAIRCGVVVSGYARIGARSRRVLGFD